MTDAATGVFYRFLLSSIRRLYEELQAVASAYGLLDSTRTASPYQAAGGRQDHSCGSCASLAPGTRSAMIKSSSACSDVGSAGITRENNATLPTTVLWMVAGTSVTTGACVACGAGAAAFFSGGRCAYLLLAMPVVINLAMAVCWLVAWGLVELTVHRSVRRLCRLVVDLHSQHKIAREAVRWVQELEVTFKALSMAPAELQQTTAGAAAAASGGGGSDGREDPAFCERPHKSVAGNSTACGGSSPCGRIQQECVNLQQDGPRGKQLPAGALRVRLCQVLEWQEDILSRVYEDVMRPKAGAQVTFRSLISQGPWTSRDSVFVGSRQFDASVRALRDTTARSWAVHSRLWAGFQIVLMQLLLSLDTRLQRGQTAAFRRRNGQVDEGKLQHPASSSREPAQRPSRALRQALITLQQQHSEKGNKLSLGEEVAEATVPTSGESVEASTATRTSGTLLPTTCVSFSLSRRHGYWRVQETGPSVASASQHRGVSQEMWALGLCRTALHEVFAVFDLLKAAADGIAAAWWVLQQLNRLEQAISTAAQVAEAAASTLRAVLEEDWALCPVPLPQPRWVPRMLKIARGRSTNGGTEAEPHKLMPCILSPPSAAFRPFSRLPGAAAPARRTALASMSRHIGASLAILRLSAPFCCCNAKQPVCSYSYGTRKRTSCLCCPNGVSGGSGDGEAGHPWKSAVTEEKENSEDAELSAAVQLTLGHLHTAIEEAERLQRALRLPGQAVETVQVSRSYDASADAPVKAPEGDEPFEQMHELPHQSLAEPLQYLEVYTAIGQNSSTNKSKCQEEAALLAVFADEDPAVRQRSHLTLRELEFRLKSRELKRQSVPCVLKDFPAITPETAAVAGGDEGRSKRTVRFFTDSQSSGRPLAEHASNAVRQCDGLEASPTPEKGPAESREGGASVFASEIGDGENARSAGINEGVAVISPQAAGGVFELETSNMPVDSSSDDGDRQLLIDSESLAFRLRQQKLRGGPNEKVWQSSEDVASQRFMSQLQGVLTEQRRKSGGGQGLCRYSMAAANTTKEEQLGLDFVAHCGDPTAFGDDISGEEEWDSCDVVEGPNCDAEAPVWVAVPHTSESSQAGITDSVQQGGTDHRQDPE